MQTIKSVLLDHFKILESLNTTFCQEHGILLFNDLNVLQNAAINSTVLDYSVYYDVPSIKLRYPFIPSHAIPSKQKKNLDNLEISISIKNIEIKYPTDIIDDPLISLDGFDIMLESCEKTSSERFISSWHLDKRLVSETYSLIEPEYHFSYGGKKMEGLYEQNWDFGSSLIIRSPRIMHPPMDIILGLDFLLNHFVDYDYRELFVTNMAYQKNVVFMKNVLWRPYALSFAKHLYPELGDSALNFNPAFCGKIVG